MPQQKTAAKQIMLWALGFLMMAGAAAALDGSSPTAPAEKIPVILDTDIGDDIDDTVVGKR